MTWRELHESLAAAGFADDEYLSLAYDLRGQWDDDVWGKVGDEWTRWIACYWVEGGSEGWYVHIDRMLPKGGAENGFDSTPMVLGKFWDWERAEKCAQFATRLVYGVRQDQPKG